MSEERRTASAEVTTGEGRWPGWIWAVPIAALAIGVWLLIRSVAQGGTNITITFDDAHGVEAGDTSLEYRGMTVGKVTGVDLAGDGSGVRVHANVDAAAAHLLTAGTRFWMRGTRPSLSDLSSLGAILSGPTIVIEPGAGAPARAFTGLTRKPIVADPRESPTVFSVAFAGAVGDLSPGDVVKLRGFPIGEVRAVGFDYDVGRDAIETPVTLALYPSLLPIAGAPQTGGEPFRAAIDRLVAAGLRAQLERDPPLIGSHRVALDMVPGAPAAQVTVANGVPEIPVAPAGGLPSVVARLNEIPLDQIAENVLDITHHVDQITSSAALHDSIVQLDASLREIRRTVQRVGPEADELLDTLRATSAQLDRTAQTAERTLGGAASQTGLHETLREIADAARAVRSLADYLDRHPEALIAGRPGD